jgi:hypothetical protein
MPACQERSSSIPLGRFAPFTRGRGAFRNLTLIALASLKFRRGGGGHSRDLPARHAAAVAAARCAFGGTIAW